MSNRIEAARPLCASDSKMIQVAAHKTYPTNAGITGDIVARQRAMKKAAVPKAAIAARAQTANDANSD